MIILTGVLKQFHRTSQLWPIICFRYASDNSPLRNEIKGDFSWLCGSSVDVLETVRGHVEIKENFITDEEEHALFKEVELGLKKKKYEFNHWDDFCGSTIAGLSLLSDSVMRLVREERTADWVDLFLSRRSLYILRDDVRFKFTHEILKDEDSFFSGHRVPRHRRISVICRNLPI